MAEFRKQARLEPLQLRQLRNLLQKATRQNVRFWTALPEKSASNPFAADVSFHSLELASRHDSRLDGASKLLFRTAAGHILETVILRIASGRHIAVCFLADRLCGALRILRHRPHGPWRSISAGRKFLDQLIQANQMLRAEGRSVRNVVFMGMGEPLHNEAEFSRLSRCLLSAKCFNIPPGRVVLSTVGIPGRHGPLCRAFPTPGPGPEPAQRPSAATGATDTAGAALSLDMLKDALLNATNRQSKKVMIEYLLLDGRQRYRAKTWRR